MKKVMNIYNRIMSIVLLMVIAFSSISVSGCGSKSTGTGCYKLYYGDENMEKLTDVDSEIAIYSENMDADTIVEYAQMLLDAMNESKKGVSVLKPEYLKVRNVKMEAGTLQIYYDGTYYDMSQKQETMYRAAVVKTLAQISDIKYVKFYVDGSEAHYKDGKSIGNMKAADFVDDSENSISNVEWVNAYVYYSNKAGDGLIKTRENICYNKNVSLEKLVVEKLIKGSSSNGCYATIPYNVSIISIAVVDGICYVNFSQEFASEMINTKASVTIYSIVNSLCSLNNISGVKIMVNGDSSIMYRDYISLDTVFTSDTSLLQQ